MKDFLMTLLGIGILVGMLFFDAWYENESACDEAEYVHSFPVKRNSGIFNSCYVKVPGHDWMVAKAYRNYLK